MELLLALLSLLTAATGVVAGARAPEAGVHQTANMISVAPTRRAAPRAAVAQVVLPSRTDDDGLPGEQVAAPSSAPLYADRRRE